MRRKHWIRWVAPSDYDWKGSSEANPSRHVTMLVYHSVPVSALEKCPQPPTPHHTQLPNLTSLMQYWHRSHCAMAHVTSAPLCRAVCKNKADKTTCTMNIDEEGLCLLGECKVSHTFFQNSSATSKNICLTPVLRSSLESMYSAFLSKNCIMMGPASLGSIHAGRRAALKRQWSRVPTFSTTSWLLGLMSNHI